jgi:hypothetical protein
LGVSRGKICGHPVALMDVRIERPHPPTERRGLRGGKKFIFSLKPKSVGSARDTSLARKHFLPIKIFFVWLKSLIFENLNSKKLNLSFWIGVLRMKKY